MTRQLVVVDCETTGLHDRAAILEVAAINVNTGEEFRFVPHLKPEDLGAAEPIALAINRYFEREVWRHAESPNGTQQLYRMLGDMLNRNTFAGSNPAFDSKLIARVTQPRWHHRLADLSAYAAGKLNIPLDDLPGLDKVAELLDIDVNAFHDDKNPRHSALGDARITAEAFRRLHEL